MSLVGPVPRKFKRLNVKVSNLGNTRKGILFGR